MSKEASVFQPTTKSGRHTTLDGFINLGARLGVNPGQGNTISNGAYVFNLITQNRIQLEAAYRSSWIAGQIIDSIADDMTRSGIEITTNDAADNITKFQSSISRLRIWYSINKLIKWGRLYGGALGVLQIEGHDLSQPLDIETVSKGQFKGIGVYDRWQLNPDLTDTISVGPDLGLPKYYNIVLGNKLGASPAMTPTGQIKVHHSRCIRMVGIELPFWQAISEYSWGESILEKIWDRLIAFDDTTFSTASLVNRASLRNIKVKDFRSVVSAGGAALDGLTAMFDFIGRYQTNEGLTVLDKDDDFENITYTFAGLSDVLLSQAQQLSGASQIPLIRLFGQAPAGLNATADGDIRMYYDSINALQEVRLRNPFETLLKVIYRSTFNQPMPEDLEFSFTPLWQMSSMDKATIAKTNTETILAARQEGTIDIPTAMRELRDTQGDFGLFSNITDEMIADAEAGDVPMPGETDNGKDEIASVRNIDSNSGDASKIGLIKRFRRLLG